MNTDNLWNEFLDKIKERITPLSYDTWFKDTKLYKLDGGTATIIVPLALHKKHLEENYIDDIEETFNSITGTNFNFKFILMGGFFFFLIWAGISFLPPPG